MRRALVSGAVLCAFASCVDQIDTRRATTATVQRPAGEHRVVRPGELKASLAAAAPGSLLVLAPGRHVGPLEIEKAVTIWGPREAVVATAGTGSTITVDAPDVRLLGFTVDGSGSRFDKTDAAVRVRANRVEVRGLHVKRALFGLLVEKAEDVHLVANHVEGTGQKAFGLRGDGIRFWVVKQSSIRDNLVTDSRDVVVWYSSENQIVGNRVRGCRYGTHFMYSHENRVADNRYEKNVVGIFVMYSRDVALHRNLIARCSGAAGVGLGVKESGNLDVVENAFLANTMSVYLDTSPLDRTHVNRFTGNHFRMSDVAIGFHASPNRNYFEANTLQDNARQVQVGGRGDAQGASWSGNCWSDYQGYDLDRDGIGDVPYELRSLAGELLGKKPPLAFFRGTPTLEIVDVVGRVLPLFAPKRLLEDPEPRMYATELEWIDAR